MAFNTENKRRSLFAHGELGNVVFPIPDSSIDEGDRPHYLGLYAGTGFPESSPKSSLGGLFPDRLYEESIYPEGIYMDELFNILNYI